MQLITRVCNKCSKNGEQRQFIRISSGENIDSSREYLYKCENCGNEIPLMI